MKHCYIVGAAPCKGVRVAPKEGDLCIAADGGYTHLKHIGIVPDIVIGDFDSLKERPEINIQIHPEQKNDTDMMLAIKHGLAAGYESFFIYGGMGGRLDHTFANIQALLYLARQGAKGILIDEPTHATVIHEGSLLFGSKMKGLVSVFAMDETAEGVNIKGLQYPLDNMTLHNSFPLGVSNAFIGMESVISVRKGSLLVIWGTCDCSAPKKKKLKML